jgi:hypothetical protein
MSNPNPTFMNYTNGDVCRWELYIDTTAFQNIHPYASGQLASVFINLALDVLPANMQLYAMQGTSIRNATSVTLNLSQGKATVFPLSRGPMVILMAFPTATSTGSTQLQFTYNLSTPYYPVQGLDA